MALKREIGSVSTTGKEVEWKISHFSSLPAKDGKYYWCPTFSFGDKELDLQIYPNGARERNSYGSIQLVLRKFYERPCPDTWYFSVSLRHVNGQKEYEQKMDSRCRTDEFNRYTFPPSLSRKELLRRRGEFLPSDVLTVVFTLNWGSSATSVSNSSRAECCLCKEIYDNGSIASHQKSCVRRTIQCPKCFKDVLLRQWLDGHECQKGRTEDALKKFSFSEIRRATKNFSHEVGKGSFGAVYKGEMDDGGVTVQVAVKKLKEIDKQFEAELKTLSSFKHDFLLSVIGYCDDPAHPCLVLEYMANGSLEDRLACKGNVQPLSWEVRLVIAYCSALGINHLHASGQVHRDVKSANILLDKDLFPKVADFGLVRIGESGESTIIQVTKIVCGTPDYMPPEAYDGDVSAKLDTFSFGVVLLELLTGLPSRHGGKRLFLYEDRLLNMLDDKARWDRSIAEELYKISKRCLIREKRDRPTISQILADLRALLPAGVRMLIMKHHSCP